MLNIDILELSVIKNILSITLYSEVKIYIYTENIGINEERYYEPNLKRGFPSIIDSDEWLKKARELKPLILQYYKEHPELNEPLSKEVLDVLQR